MVIIDAQTIARIILISESYRIRRDAIQQALRKPTHLQFTQFCNDNAALLERTLGKPTRDEVNYLYRRVHLRELTLDCPENSTAFRELLGTLLGLHDIRTQAALTAQHN